MTMSLTFPNTDSGSSRVPRWSATLITLALIAIAVPVSACEKTAPALIANAAAQTRVAGAFTGESVNGVPVYRLPSITVVGRRGADVAKTHRDDDATRMRRSRANAAALAPARNNVATTSREVREAIPCVG